MEKGKFINLKRIDASSTSRPKWKEDDQNLFPFSRENRGSYKKKT